MTEFFKQYSGGSASVAIMVREDDGTHRQIALCSGSSAMWAQTIDALNAYEPQP
jgi:hypothetical protein